MSDSASDRSGLLTTRLPKGATLKHTGMNINLYRAGASVCLGLGLNLVLGCSTLDAEVPAVDAPLPLPTLSFGAETTSIAALRQQPQSEQPVEIRGIIRHRAPLLDDSWIYQVDDGTDRIWVLTEQFEPELDQTVQVRGVMEYEEILIGNLDIGEYYLLEESATPQSVAE
ncbi:MAG: hypothetical protein F6J97_25105 [Leptolyngbya sp. SIO4C1]|nr:hypothetical protein [Leptolyngbya sp. SIO4C1]